MTHIHWPSTARLDRLMTKEFEGAGVNEIWLFVDLHSRVQVGAGAGGTEEYVIALAASLGRALIESGHAVGLIAHGDEMYRLLPRKDEDHMWALLRALAVARADGNVPLASLLSQESGNLSAGAVALIVSPGSGQSLDNLFRFLTRRGVLVVPILADASSFEASYTPRATRAGHDLGSELATVVRKGDDLAVLLGNVLDRIASY